LDGGFWQILHLHSMQESIIDDMKRGELQLAEALRAGSARIMRR
jgi:hypothetical protein